MIKILLADNEGVVLNALRNMINAQYGETCDVRTAKTARYLRKLTHKFIPDIAVINIEMPELRGFDIIQEIRSFHGTCIFITVSTYDRQVYRTEAENLRLLAHVSKPLFREKILPPITKAVEAVKLSQKRRQKNVQIQERFDLVVPVVEHGLIHELFFTEKNAVTIENYLSLMSISQRFAKPVRLTFGEQPTPGAPGTLANPIGSAIRIKRYYDKFRSTVRDYFPLALCGPVMSNHIFFLLPCWKLIETPAEKQEFETVLADLLEKLEEEFEQMSFYVKAEEIMEFTDLDLKELL
ncbi:MAG: response regulator transcription factor [Marvinbryantia sp.]|jgi:two-component system response regulator YesN